MQTYPVLRTYHVLWEIEVEAKDAIDAAKQAKEIQQDYDSRGNVFIVKTQDQPDTTIDLDKVSE